MIGRLLIGVLAVCLSAGIADAQTGSLTGRVAVKGLPASPDVVVSLEAPGLKVTPPARPVAIDQKRKRLLPEFVPVVTGTTVQFLNSDSVQHNVFSPEGHYNLGTWRRGSRDHTFTKHGVYVQLCRLHPEMQAIVVVLDTPYFTIADRTGAFEINKVPPGKYTLVAWSDGFKAARQPVSIPPADRIAVSITLTR